MGATIWMPALETRISIPPKRRADLLDAGVHLGLVGHVHLDGECRRAARIEFFRRGAGRIEIEVGNGDLRALA